MGIIVPSPLVHTSMILAGQSYWKVKLRSGKEFSELDVSFDLLRGSHSIDWALDIVGSGDNGAQSDGQAKIAELTLCTPQGNATLKITEPYSAFQLKCGASAMFSNERILLAQIIGRVEDKESGLCTCCLWDVQEQRLDPQYMSSVKNLGYRNIGALSLEVVGLRL
jgi:hypothetical protein